MEVASIVVAEKVLLDVALLVYLVVKLSGETKEVERRWAGLIDTDSSPGRVLRADRVVSPLGLHCRMIRRRVGFERENLGENTAADSRS